MKQAALAMAVLAVLASGAQAESKQPDPMLRQAAVKALQPLLPLAKGEQLDMLVEINRDSVDGDWVLGSVTQPLPVMTTIAAMDHVPLSRLFLARRDAQGWTLELESSSGFAAMLEQAPAGWLSAEERQAWRSQLARPGQPFAPNATNLGLPWRQGAAWRMTGGPHGYSGESQPYDSIDFAGGDGRVLAPQAGVIYKSCVRGGSALVKLVHDNGFSSTYYHMINLNTLADGTRVNPGAYLGTIGNGLPCGGSTTGPHVHFSLLYQGRAEPVNGKLFGGWQFFAGSRAYQGYALRNGTRVNVGGLLNNYGGGGAPAGASGVATPAKGEGQVNLRKAPSLSAGITGTVKRGDSVALQCHVRAEAVDGVWGRTDVWNRTRGGDWISDGFLDTGSNAPVVPLCASASRPW